MSLHVSKGLTLIILIAKLIRKDITLKQCLERETRESTVIWLERTTIECVKIFLMLSTEDVKMLLMFSTIKD